MKINVHSGHNAHVTGASKYLNELTESRKVKNEVMRLLKANNHTVYDCTDDAGKTQNDNLKNIVSKCNARSVDLDISIHLNSGGGTGVETYIYKNSSVRDEATRICSKIANTLGINNRGVKDGSSFYVLKHTKAPAILIECCFVDSKIDREKWDANKCAKAIVEGILNQSIVTSPKSFRIKIDGVSKSDVLNVREKPDASSKIAEKFKHNNSNEYTIIETKKVGSQTWGKLKSGVGWIDLKYTKKV